MNSRQLAITTKQLRIMTVLLVVQFILGVTLTTLIDYSPSKHSAVQITFLVSHIVVAIGLLIGGIFRLVLSFKWHSVIWSPALGLSGIILAMISGSIAATNSNNVAVFLMAIGFLIAFAGYGFNMSEVSRSKYKR